MPHILKWGIYIMGGCAISLGVMFSSAPVYAAEPATITYYTGDTLERTYIIDKINHASPEDLSPEALSIAVDGSMDIATENGYTRVHLSPGTYTLAHRLNVNKSLILEGTTDDGKNLTTIQLAPQTKPEEKAMLTAASGTKEAPTTIQKLTLDGQWDPASKQLDIYQRGIVLHPLTKLPDPTSPTSPKYYVGWGRKHDVTIQDMTIRNMGGTGIYMEFVDNIKIIGSSQVKGAETNRLENLGYAGIAGYSANNVDVDRTLVSDVGVSGQQAYGMAFSWKKGTTDANQLAEDDPSRFPTTTEGKAAQSNATYTQGYYRSQHDTVTNSTIMNIPTWEGLDTHSGYDINFKNNRLLGVRFPIVVGGMDYPEEGTENLIAAYPPKKILIQENDLNQETDNTIYNPNKKTSERGIVATGTKYQDLLQNPNTLGFLEGLIIDTNHVNAIKTTIPSRGGISIHVTKAANIIDNILTNSEMNGLVFMSSNKKTNMSGNGISGMIDNTGTGKTADIGIRGSHNNGEDSNTYAIPDKPTDAGTNVRDNILGVGASFQAILQEAESTANALQTDTLPTILTQPLESMPAWDYLEKEPSVLPDERSYYEMESGKPLLTNEK
ncbi:right-handed parallel beta-helix repeat-containing protein [Listeria rustica]|nr:right-handed parallel beta-helix repeat-containing protein [Listeria rustica]